MKIVKLEKVSKPKIGKLYKNGVKLERLEEDTAIYLTLFGFNIEAIRPVSIPKSKNPDFLINGTIWEVKTLTTTNKNTIKERFRKAKKQSDKVIFDLRNIKGSANETKNYILKLFSAPGRIRRIIIIEKSGICLDIYK